ncbi:MAG: DUF4834 family protein [Flavobacteriales bacterium]|nr:DUF4834 family protein [Flavobacteriales bacterium]
MIIEEASIPGVFRTVLIILAIYFLVRTLGRLLMPLMNGSKTTFRSGGRYAGEDNRKEGDVTVEYTDKKKGKRRSDSGEGDYIDFEELD